MRPSKLLIKAIRAIYAYAGLPGWLSTAFHKYGDVCWERDGVQIEARRRVDAGTSARRSNKEMGPSRPNPSGGGGLLAISLSLVVDDATTSTPPHFSTSPRKTPPHTLPHLWKSVLSSLQLCCALLVLWSIQAPLVAAEAHPVKEQSRAQAPGSQAQAQDLPGGSGQFSWKGPDGRPLPFRTPENVEEFLRSAQIVSVEETQEGINRPWKVLLEKDGIRMNACFRKVRVQKKRARLKSGEVIRDFRDDAIFECAAYRLSRLLGLTCVPPTVNRKIKGERGTIQAWIEGGMMEKERQAGGSQAPDRRSWLLQMQTLRLFDNLIFNEDRNAGNMIITPDWKLWMIDHTRCFRSSEDLFNPSIVRYCDLQVWKRMKGLTEDVLQQELGDFLKRKQIKVLLIRRDRLVEHLQSLIEKYGKDRILVTF